MDTRQAIEPVAARVVSIWDLNSEVTRDLYVGEGAGRAGSHKVTWTEGVQRPLQREALWRVRRAAGKLVWSSLDMGRWCRRPHWLTWALSRLLADVNEGLRERDLDVLEPAAERHDAWRCVLGVGPGRSLRLDAFDPDDEPSSEDVVHLRDLPELLWLAAGFPGGETGEWNQGFLNLTRGLFEVLGLTDHWLSARLPTKLESRSQIVDAALGAPSDRASRTLRELWTWRDRLMASAEPWAGILMCQHPVRRGRSGRWWEEWEGGEGAEGEIADLLADLGDEVAKTVLDNIEVSRRIGETMVRLWEPLPLLDEPVIVREARAAGRWRS